MATHRLHRVASAFLVSGLRRRIRATTYYWVVVVVVIAVVLIAGFEKYRAQHMRGGRYHASLSSDRL